MNVDARFELGECPDGWSPWKQVATIEYDVQRDAYRVIDENGRALNLDVQRVIRRRDGSFQRLFETPVAGLMRAVDAAGRNPYELMAGADVA